MLKTLTVGLFLAVTPVGVIGTVGIVSVISEPPVMGKPSDGNIIGNAKGMALYFLDKDVVGNSNCNDKCAKELPPFKTDADANAVGEWTIVIRDEKSLTWAF